MNSNYYINDINQILEIAEQQQDSDIFLSLKMIMFDTLPNLNKCQYTREFLAEIVENQEKYACLPLVADVSLLTTGHYKTKSLTHLQDKKTGEFRTTQIGSFHAFELNELEDGTIQLIGYARVPKRHKKVIAALLALHKENKLKFSYEIAVANYVVKDGIKSIDVSEQNYIIGLAVVDKPACVSSSSILAASLDSNIDENLGEEMEDKLIKNVDMLFEQCETYLTAELNSEQIRQKIFKALPLFLDGKIGRFDNGNIYNVDIRFQFDTYVVVYDWLYGNFYKISFVIDNGEVKLLELSKVTMDFIVAEVTDFKKEKEVNQMTIEELNAKIAELETACTEKDAEIATKNEQIVKFGEDLQKAQDEAKVLLPFKEQVEKAEAEKVEAEKVEQRSQLKEKAAKVLSENELSEIAEAIESLNFDVVNAKIADKYVAIAAETPKKDKEAVFVAHRITDSNKLDSNSSIFERQE